MGVVSGRSKCGCWSTIEANVSVVSGVGNGEGARQSTGTVEHGRGHGGCGCGRGQSGCGQGKGQALVKVLDRA